MTAYYPEKLSGKRLQRCYEIAPERVRRYLEAEIAHTQERLLRTGTVLELGCGYGRIAGRLASVAARVVGVDIAAESIELARQLWGNTGRCEFLPMDAVALGFPDGSFDAVVCLQNGICAFRVDQVRLLEEALRVTREGGIVLLSSYSDRFWPYRLAWFEIQAAEGLVGRIDRSASRHGVIVCEDGFRSGRLTPDDFHSLCSTIGVNGRVCEVDRSSVFCEIIKPGVFDLQPVLRGDLLELRPLTPEDRDALFAVASDPLIWEQHPVKTRCEQDGFRAFFQESLESGGALIAVDLETGAVIGSSRFHGYNPEASEVEIGWTFLARSHWGGRYNGEMKRLMLNHAFRFVDRVVFLIGPENLRSRKAVEKIGGVLAGSRRDGGGRESVVYAITAEAHRRRVTGES